MERMRIDEITPRQMLGKLVYLPVQVYGIVADEEGVGVKAQTLTSDGKIIEDVDFLYDGDAEILLSDEEIPVTYEITEGELDENDS